MAWRTVVPVAERLLKLDPVRERIKGHTVLAVLRHAPQRSRPTAAPHEAVSP
jgi:hypothetical protein